MDAYQKLGYPPDKIKLILNQSFDGEGLKQSQIEKALDTTIKLETPSVPGYSEIQTAYNEEKKLFLTGQETLDELMQNVTDRRQEVLDANK